MKLLSVSFHWVDSTMINKPLYCPYTFENLSRYFYRESGPSRNYLILEVEILASRLGKVR